jgi:hypothetical protein
MPKVNPFHTTSTEYSSTQRSVYHDNSLCGYGKEIKPEHRAPNTAGRPRCGRCNTLAAEGK